MAAASPGAKCCLPTKLPLQPTGLAPHSPAMYVALWHHRLPPLVCEPPAIFWHQYLKCWPSLLPAHSLSTDRGSCTMWCPSSKVVFHVLFPIKDKEPTIRLADQCLVCSCVAPVLTLTLEQGQLNASMNMVIQMAVDAVLCCRPQLRRYQKLHQRLCSSWLLWDLMLQELQLPCSKVIMTYRLL